MLLQNIIHISKSFSGEAERLTIGIPVYLPVQYHWVMSSNACESHSVYNRKRNNVTSFFFFFFWVGNQIIYRLHQFLFGIYSNGSGGYHSKIHLRQFYFRSIWREFLLVTVSPNTDDGWNASPSWKTAENMLNNREEGSSSFKTYAEQAFKITCAALWKLTTKHEMMGIIRLSSEIFFLSFRLWIWRLKYIKLSFYLLLRHYAASRKVAGSSPDKVDFFKIDLFLPAALALGSTQPLTEMSTRNL
jgi:hypothetical protein